MDLLRLGLTFPGVVQRKQTIENLPALGLLTLAGLTPERFHPVFHDISGAPDTTPLPNNLDVVALTSLTATAPEAYRIARRFREQGAKVILGGLHATLASEDAAPHVDSIVIGEGESVWPRILGDLEKDQLQPVYDARPLPYDLAQSPMPRFDLLPPDRYPRFTVQTHRGCPFRCEFCAASIRLSPTYKVKPVDRVIAEIREIRRLWPNGFIEFADDNTFVNRTHSRALMKAVARERIRWFTESDVSIAEDTELLKLIRDAGCMQLLIGFESPSAAGLNRLEQRGNWKLRQLDKYAQAVETIQKHGITVNGCFVVGLDGDTPEVFDSIYQFVRETGLFEVQITLQTPFPGTPLYERLLQQKRILKPGAWERCTLFDINYQPASFTVEELKEGFHQLVARLYEPSFIQERAESFREHLRTRVRRQLAGV